jgi:hypothetical protein
VSIWDAYRTQTATIATPAAVDPAAPWLGAVAASTTTSLCRFEREQKRVVREDGGYDLSTGVFWFPAGVIIPAGAIITVDSDAGATFTPMAVTRIRDENGVEDEVEVPVT